MKDFIHVIAVWLMLAAVAACGLLPKGDSIVGPPGERGDTGAGTIGLAGESGPQGQPGRDATPVTVIPLCPGESVYPDTFVEYAFCVGGKLYATYSANGGFTTYLPPGTYNSSAVNSACTFTVTENCNVSQ